MSQQTRTILSIFGFKAVELLFSLYDGDLHHPLRELVTIEEAEQLQTVFSNWYL